MDVVKEKYEGVDVQDVEEVFAYGERGGNRSGLNEHLGERGCTNLVGVTGNSAFIL